MAADIFSNVGILILVLAGGWLLQLWLSLAQSKRFHRLVMRLRKEGDRTSVGVSGSKWAFRVYAVLVVTKNRTVARAQRFTGLTVFARAKPEPSVHGLPLDRFLDDRPTEGIPPRLWKAFQHAAQFIREADERENNPDSIVVREASSMPNGYSLNGYKRD